MATCIVRYPNEIHTPRKHDHQYKHQPNVKRNVHHVRMNQSSNSHNNNSIRRKVIVIPFVRCFDNSIKVMLVKDKRSGDYAFLSGGVKSHETIMCAAIRELHEETYGALRGHDIMTSSCVKEIKFINTFRPQHRDEDLQLKKKLGDCFPNGITEVCHVVVFEISERRLEDALHVYQDSYVRLNQIKKLEKYLETTDVLFEDIRTVSKWERDQMRGVITSPDANGIHLWDVHVKNALAMKVMTVLT